MATAQGVFRPTVRLECGDALDLLRREPSESVNCIVTSPPYARLIRYASGPRRGDTGENAAPRAADYADWLLPIIAQMARVLMPGGVLALNLGGEGAAVYPEEIAARVPRETTLVLHERMCWVKANAIPTGHRGTHLIPEWEPIWVFRRGEHLSYFGRDDIRRPYAQTTMRRAERGNLHRGSHGNHAGQAHPYVRGNKAETVNPAGRDACNVLWAAPEQRSEFRHPARFPETIPDFFIRAYCPEGGLVLDPFVGSGTTCAVAARLGRNSVGFDLNGAYLAIARRRAWPQAQPRMALTNA